MLWDLTWAYVEKYGFDDDFLNGNGGNNRVMQLVTDGLKLQQEIGAAKYMECSAFTQMNVELVFEEAVRTVLLYRNRHANTNKKCYIL